MKNRQRHLSMVNGNEIEVMFAKAKNGNESDIFFMIENIFLINFIINLTSNGCFTSCIIYLVQFFDIFNITCPSTRSKNTMELVHCFYANVDTR